VGAVVLAVLLVAPVAEAAWWLDARGGEGTHAGLAERGGLLKALWHHLTWIFQEDSDNRGSLDPNG
jgi:hypothetical protein